MNLRLGIDLGGSKEAVAIAVAAENSDPAAEATSGIINVLDPEVIVLGGGLSKLTRLYERVPALWQRYVFSDRVDTRLVLPLHGDSSGVRGAAWLWPVKVQVGGSMG